MRNGVMNESLAIQIGAVTELCGSHHGVVFTAELETLGLSAASIARLVRSGTLRRLFRGAFALGDDLIYEEDIYRRTVAAFLKGHLHEGRPLAGGAALAHFGLPIWGRPPDGIHVIGGKQGRRALVRPLDTVKDRDLIEWGGVVTTSVARSLVDAARLCSVEVAIAAADRALRLGLVTMDEIQDVLDREHGYRGIVRARECLGIASPLSESPGESVSHLNMKRSGIPMPEQQHRFYDAHGFVARADFRWESERLVGEFDGRYKYGRHNPSKKPVEDVVAEEKFREDRLRALGLHVVRWTTASIVRLGPLADIIRTGMRLTNKSRSVFL